MKNKNVLLISPFPPLIGGVSISSARLHDRLIEDGYNVKMYNIKSSISLFDNPLCDIIRYLFIPIYIFFNIRFDVIHCHVSGIYRKLFIVRTKKIFFAKSRVVFTIHGDVLNLLSHRLSNECLTGADKIICVQKGDSNKLPDCFRHKAVDIPAFISPKVDLDSEKDIPNYVLNFVRERKDNIIMVINGGIVLNELYYDLYGFEDALNLYKQLIGMGYKMKLLMIKNGSHNTSLQEKFVSQIKHTINSCPDILFVENEQFDLWPLFKYTDIYLRPTKSDGDSLSVREALLFKNIAVASDVANRPDGTITYNIVKNELLEVMVNVLENIVKNDIKLKDNVTFDFYELIKKQYEL